MKTQTTKAQALKHIFDNIAVNAATGCWEWTGSRTKDGYGQLSREAIVERFGAKGVHRLAKILIDDWQPESRHEQTRHLCHNRACCNPDHLETGTAADNAADKVRDGTAPRGEAHPSAKLSDADVKAIREQRGQGIRAVDLAARFGVGKRHIYNIAAGRARVLV